VRTPLLLLMAAAGIVLLMACANVTGVLLVRVVRRQQELALRVALGASRGRIVRWLLGESLIFSLLGGVAGLALATAGIEAFNRWAPALPRGGDVELDARVFGFALLLSIGCTILVGLLPSLGASRVGGVAALAGRRTSTNAGGGVRSVLVVAQIALSLVLMIGAGLLGSTLMRLAAVDPGFESDGLVTFDISLPGARYDWPEGTNRFLTGLEDRIRATPGVESAGVGWPMPLSGSRWSSVYRVPGSASDAQQPLADYRVVTPEYFRTLGVPFVEGRTFEISDPRHAVIVGRRIAEGAWPEGGWLGREVVADPWGRGDTTFVVVGVVEEVLSRQLRDEPNGALYFDARGWSWADWEFDVLVRTERRVSDIVPELREVVAALDPEVPLANEATMNDLVDAQLESSRAALGLMALFSAVAGLLAFLGLYGVIAYSVRMRTRELGIRIALGASRTGAVRLVLAQGLRLTVVGVALGLLGAFLLSGFLRSWLFGVGPTDPTTYLLAAGGLGLLSMLAAGVPARHAARLEPMDVLRNE